MRLRRSCWFESDAHPPDTLHNLDKLHLGPIAKAVERAKNFLFLKFGVLMDRDLLGKPAEIRPLINLKAAGQY